MKHRAVAIIIKNGKILLIHRIKNKREYFVFPGGGIEENETKDGALQREVKEELNLDVKSKELIFQIKNGDHQEFYFLIKSFLGEVRLGGEEKETMNENNQYHLIWFKLKEAFSLKDLFPKEARNKLQDINNYEQLSFSNGK